MSADIWQAVEYESVKENSRTKPLVLWCERIEDGRIEKKRFLVKSPGHPEVLESNLFAEMFGNLLAREFGITTPEPAIVVLSKPFIESIQDLILPQIQLRVGFGVGCEYIAPFPPLLSDYVLPVALRPQAAMIYAWDMVSANFDRRIGNCNCALHGDRILAYDFECSFSFLQALFGPRPWMVSKLGIAQHHVFQGVLKSHGAQWAAFIKIFNSLDESRLTELVKDFPTPWLSNREKVFDYLFEAQSHDKQLMIELEASLLV